MVCTSVHLPCLRVDVCHHCMKWMAAFLLNASEGVDMSMIWIKKHIGREFDCPSFTTTPLMEGSKDLTQWVGMLYIWIGFLPLLPPVQPLQQGLHEQSHRCGPLKSGRCAWIRWQRTPDLQRKSAVGSPKWSTHFDMVACASHVHPCHKRVLVNSG
jgi:hypothetical protein